LSARRRCRADMAVGDRLFGERKYADALNRYKRAAAFAPDIAESFFRQGHAYLASSRLKLAARAFQRGFDVDPDIKRKGFNLTELYDIKKNPVPKKLHFDDLARTALKTPGDSESYLLIGLLLHYDGQSDRAEKFFQQADRLPGKKYRFRKLFLPKNAKPANAKPAKASGIDL
jgi:tetratricopeptide (TPR) repeat protein